MTPQRVDPRHFMADRRRTWLFEMGERTGIIPAPGTVYGVKPLMRCLLPDLFGDCHSRTLDNYRPMRTPEDYAELEAEGIMDLENTHAFNLQIHIHGRYYSKRRITCNVLVDKNGRGPQKAKWHDRDHARCALLWKMPYGSHTLD